MTGATGDRPRHPGVALTPRASSSRYVIGIDLGTTNSVLAFADTLAPGEAPRTFPVRQRDGADTESEYRSLPSFLYLPSGREVSALGERPVPGRFAEERRAVFPDKVVAAAKSWLAYAGVDREERFLPPGAAGRKVSPVEAQTLYLAHLAGAWDSCHAGPAPGGAVPPTEGDGGGPAPRSPRPPGRFASQQVVITVPASFDEDARRLTLAAARGAGFPEDTALLEEPLAAFYSYLGREGRERPGGGGASTVLVVDVGGGTTDFSLVERRADGAAERVAVGDHLLVGGDSLDMLVARTAESQTGRRFSRHQYASAVASARAIKEAVLEGTSGETAEMFVPPDGARLFEEGTVTRLDAAALSTALLEGFFPACPADARPSRGTTALRESGLPYPADPAVTRHLAAFLDGRGVDAVLFAGGSTRSRIVRDRILDVIASWQGGRRPDELPSGEADLAVAHGAVRFGLALRGRGARVGGGYPRSLYLELAADGGPVLVCVVPRGTPYGTEHPVGTRTLTARLGGPVSFSLRSSSSRAGDRPGDVVSAGAADDLRPLPPLRTVLTGGTGDAEVRAVARIDETGLLTLECSEVEGDRRWTLEFSTGPAAEEQERSPAGVGAASDRGRIGAAASVIDGWFGKGRGGGVPPKRVFATLEHALGAPRDEWTVPLLRGLWPPLADGIGRRAKSPAHEEAWFALAGFALRPGYGAEADPFRLGQVRGLVREGPVHKKERRVLLQSWIFWRRIAAGLGPDDQRVLAAAVRPNVLSEPEGLRLFASLEHAPPRDKAAVGQKIVDLLARGSAAAGPHHYWALARLAARYPVFAGVQAVVPAEVVEAWAAALTRRPWRPGDPLVPVFAAAARRTGDRTRDLSEAVLSAVAGRMREAKASPEEIEHVTRECGPPPGREAAAVLFGEDLPAGLSLTSGAP